MSKSSSRRIYESWSKQFDKKFTGKKISCKLLCDMDWEIKKLCRKLDEQTESINGKSN